MIRVGTVTSTNKDAHTARVFFDESDGLESWDLPVLVARPGDYSLPPKDAQVLCAMEPGPEGLGYVLGVLYNEVDEPPTDDAGARVLAGDDVRLGSADATDAVALAPAVKTEIQKVLDYAKGIKTAVQAGVVVANDGGASLKTTVLAAWPLPPTIDEPGAEKVVAE